LPLGTGLFKPGFGQFACVVDGLLLTLPSVRPPLMQSRSGLRMA
jgi:hypothetical protein